MILLDDVDINLIKVVDMNGINVSGGALGVMESAGIKGFVGGTNEATIYLEVTEEEGVCVVSGGPVGWRQGEKCG